MKYFKKGNFIIVKDASDQEKNSFNLATINRVEIDDLQKKIKFGDGELNFSNFISFTLEDGTIKLKADFPNFSDLKTWALSNFFFVAKSGGGAGGGGSVTNVSITSSNGITSSITDNSTTPAITLGLGNITPTSVNSTGSITGSNLSGTNTGDETKSSIEEKLGVSIVNVIDAEGDLSVQVPTAQAFDDAITPVITNLEQQITNLSGKTEWQSLTLGGTFSQMFDANTTPVDITQTLNDPLQFTKTSTNGIVDTTGTAPNILLKSSLARDNYTALSITFRASGVFQGSSERRFDIYLQRNDNLVTIGIGSIFAGANGAITSFNNSVCNFSVSSDINAGLNDGWLTQGYRLFIVGTNSNTSTSITFTNIMLRIQYF